MRVFHWQHAAAQALSACIHGYCCRNTDMGRLCNLLHLSLAALRCQPFFKWVPSQANPADLSSHEQGEEGRAFFYKKKAQLSRMTVPTHDELSSSSMTYVMELAKRWGAKFDLVWSASVHSIHIRCHGYVVIYIWSDTRQANLRGPLNLFDRSARLRAVTHLSNELRCGTLASVRESIKVVVFVSFNKFLTHITVTCSSSFAPTYLNESASRYLSNKFLAVDTRD